MSPDGSGGWFSTSIQATPRPFREGKHRGEPRRFPPTADNPITSASVRSISKDTASPAPKMKRPSGPALGGGGGGLLAVSPANCYVEAYADATDSALG